MPQPSLLEIKDHNHIRRLHLGAAPAHPLSLEMIHTLEKAMDDAATDPSIHVLILQATGHIFCAGHDLKEIAHHRKDADQGKAFLTTLFTDCARMMLKLAQFPKPTLALVDGIATAAGLQLMASCDIVYATSRAQFCLPGVNNGGFCTTPAVAVSRCIGQKALMELLLSGQPKDSDWALRTGLVTQVFSSKHTLEEEAQTFARTLAQRNIGPITCGKAALHAQQDMPLKQAYAHATPVMISHFMDAARLHAEAKSKFKD